MKADLRDVSERAREHGWVVERTNSNHWRFIPPDPTKPIVVTGGTPSDYRAYKNFLSQLKRSGLDLRKAA